jgi:dimethylargininase
LSPIWFDQAIVRRPSRSVVDGLSAVAGPKPSYDRIAREHAAYIAALNEAGLEVEILGPLEPFPDSIFVEDTALVFSAAAIALRPGAPTRSGEVAEMLPTLKQRFDQVLELTEGHVDGGDVLTTPSKVYIGQSARTDAQGAQALIKLLAKLGIKGIAVKTPPGVLHLKSDCALIDEETILMTARLAASNPFLDLRALIVPEGEDPAANALRLNDRILVSEFYPRTHDLLARHAKVVALPTTEIAKIDAGLSCMSLRWKE